MTDNAQKPLDLDTLSDEEFMKLDPSTLQAFIPSEGDTNVPDTNIDQPDSNVESPNSEDRTEEGESDSSVESTKITELETQPSEPATSSPKDSKTESVVAKTTDKPTTRSTSSESSEEKSDEKKTEISGVNPTVAMDFYSKVTATFKADGKDIQVRSPEDAVRLMQMGVNYSRRMAEMKPLRAQNEMLKAQGLDNPDKLNFMIEVMKGKPEAIQKLLRDVKIDPIDIDTSKESTYKPVNHAVDPKTLAFKEAIDNTLAAEGGPELISEINKSWDDVSKEALRDQPIIFQNLLDQKKSGVYVKIKKELDYQRTMGFLTDVPFVKAYHQVGEAMQKAGVFGPNLTPKPKTQVQSNGGMAPIDTGTRKAASIAPAPNLSSTQQPRAVPSREGSQISQPDYSTMSDEEFLKLKPPS